MEIILKQDVANLGHKDDIVVVKNGYAVNYLIPQGMAVMATPSAKKVHAENMRQRAHKEAKLRESYFDCWLYDFTCYYVLRATYLHGYCI